MSEILPPREVLKRGNCQRLGDSVEQQVDCSTVDQTKDDSGHQQG